MVYCAGQHLLPTNSGGVWLPRVRAELLQALPADLAGIRILGMARSAGKAGDC